MEFITVATFDLSTEAHIAMGRLQAEDIYCHLADEHLVQTDWLYSIAVGGIKLQVLPEDVERARQILARDDSLEDDELCVPH